MIDIKNACKKCGHKLSIGWRNGDKDEDLVACHNCQRQWEIADYYGEH